MLKFAGTVTGLKAIANASRNNILNFNHNKMRFINLLIVALILTAIVSPISADHHAKKKLKLNEKDILVEQLGDDYKEARREVGEMKNVCVITLCYTV